MQAAMLAKEAAKTGAKKWATVAPNYAYGKEAVAAFKAALTEARAAEDHLRTVLTEGGWLE